MRLKFAIAICIATFFAVAARADDFNVAALPGLQWWASAADSQLAQNPDGSGAVTSGSSVGFISDLSGNGRNAVMGNSIISGGDAFRPEYQSDVVGFEPGILFNGSTSFLSLERAFFNGSSSATVAIAIEADGADETGRYVLGGGNATLGFGSLGEPDAFFIQSNNQAATVNTSTIASLNGSQGSYDTEILIARYQAGGDLDLWANGTLAGSVPVSALGPTNVASPTIPLLGNVNFANNSTGLVAPSSTASGFDFLEGVATNSALSNTQISQLYNYLSEKYTGVQPTAISPNLYWSSSVNPQESAPATISNPGHIEGVAVGNNEQYIFQTGVVAAYDNNWNLLNYNQAIGAGIYPAGSSIHSGDGDYQAGKLFAPLEQDLNGNGATIAVYDATKSGLPLITAKTLTGPQHEMSGLVVVPTAGTDGVIFVTSYYANEGGTELWMYNYADGNVESPNFGTYLGNLQIPAGISNIQGVAYKAPYFYFSGTTLDRVLYQNGTLANQDQVMWQTPNTVQGLTIEGSNILQVLQSGSTTSTVETLSSLGFTQMNPTGFNAWNENAGDSFGNAAAWSTSVPNAPGTAVLFGDGAGTWVHADSIPITVDNAYTAGSLSFDTTAGTSYSLVSDGQAGHGITLNSGTGAGASINVYSGNHSIGANLTIADAGGLTFDIVGGSTLTITGSINQSVPSSLTLADSGQLILAGTNSYTGGTTVRFGTLVTTGNGSLGSGPLTVNASTDSVSSVIINGAESIAGLSGTVQQTGAATVTINPGASLTVNQSNATTFNGTLANSGTFIKSGSGTLELDAAPTLGANSSLQVAGNGTLRFNVTSGTASIGSGATVSVAAGATLQLAGSVSALSAGSSLVDVVNNGSTAAGGGLVVTGTNQSIGTLSATPTTGAPAAAYNGDTVVGDGVNAANLTATQILQNSLTINAGSTVTILPSANAAQADTTAATAGAAVSSAGAASPTPAANAISSSTNAISEESNAALAAIQAAIDSGSITDSLGERLEIRIDSIEQMAARDQNLDVIFLENRVLDQLPSTSPLQPINSSAAEQGATLLALDSGQLGFGNGGDDSIALGTPVVSGQTSVPEPSTFVIAAIGGLGFTRAVRRRLSTARGARC